MNDHPGSPKGTTFENAAELSVRGERYTNIFGRDLRCFACGAIAADIAPDFRLDPDPDDLFGSCVTEVRAYWHCANGHPQRFHWRRK